MSQRKINRRKFLQMSAAGAAGLIIASCASVPETPAPAAATATTAPQPTEAPKATDTKAPEATQVPTQVPTPTPLPEAKFKQSTFLDADVKSGKLPPVEERLPTNPRVIKGLGEEQGVFGGEMRLGFVGNSPEWGGLLFIAAWEHLVSWKADFSGIEYNLVESIESTPDVTQYTLHLRKGLKWSDGQPFNADDIMFYLEDVVLNTDLNPGGVADWLAADQAKGFKPEKIDDFTVKLTFPKPYGLFLYNLAQWNGRMFAMYPKHYLTQFHKKYNDKVDDLVKKDGSVADWKALFFKFGPGNWGDPGSWYKYPELPSLYPWITTQPLGTGTQIKLARNPYYWKVDEKGNQLPYIDTILGISYQDAESRTLAMLNGDLDAIKDPGSENRVQYYDAMNAGKPIQIFTIYSDGANVNSIHFNQTIADKVKADVFASKDFRIGMSYAINRQEMIEIVFNGQGKPSQVAPLEDSPLYTAGLDTQYVEYDVAKANEYLDKVLPKKSADGFRSPDGKPFKIIFTAQNDLSYGTTYVQEVELLIGYWKKVGVNVVLNSIPGPQFDQNKKDNKIEGIIFTGEGGAGICSILDPRYFAPEEYFGMFGNAWGYWRTNATNGEVKVEPPQSIKDARAKYDNVLVQPTTELQIEAMKAVMQDAKENFYVIGIARNAPMYYPYHKRMGGFPKSWYDGWIEGVEKITYPEQWFIKA